MSGPLPLWAPAPAKINLGLFIGPLRADGRHELVSVMQSISLADELTLDWAPEGVAEDQLHCPGLEIAPEQNLALRALEAFRAASGWDAPPLSLTLTKRVPIGAGLGGGSGDAAAVLRLAALASGIDDRELLQRIASTLGADVAAQVIPGRWLASGAGEILQPLKDPSSPLGVLVLGGEEQLSTADVYRQADLAGKLRGNQALQQRAGEIEQALADGAQLPRALEGLEASLLENDLEGPAISLCPSIERRLAHAREAGADIAMVSGSGSAVLGLFSGPNGPQRAEAAQEELTLLTPRPVCATSVNEGFARARPRARPPAASQ